MAFEFLLKERYGKYQRGAWLAGSKKMYDALLAKTLAYDVKKTAEVEAQIVATAPEKAKDRVKLGLYIADILDGKTTVGAKVKKPTRGVPTKTNKATPPAEQPSTDSQTTEKE
jgi:hypothetical protein